MHNISTPIAALWGVLGVYMVCGYLSVSPEVRFSTGSGALNSPVNIFHHTPGLNSLSVILFQTETLYVISYPIPMVLEQHLCCTPTLTLVASL